jgi:hypothetical protein
MEELRGGNPHDDTQPRRTSNPRPGSRLDAAGRRASIGAARSANRHRRRDQSSRLPAALFSHAGPSERRGANRRSARPPPACAVRGRTGAILDRRAGVASRPADGHSRPPLLGTAAVVQGAEHETLYSLRSQAMLPQLVPGRQTTYPTGDVSAFAPPGDIHLVQNRGPGTAISIHVYGADIARYGSSIRRTYAEDLIVGPMPAIASRHVA